MKRKFIINLLVVIVALVLVGCGKKTVTTEGAERMEILIEKNEINLQETKQRGKRADVLKMGTNSEEKGECSTGHSWYKFYWTSEPTCTSHAYFNLLCSSCGVYGGDGTDPAISHTIEYSRIARGNCKNPTVVVGICTMCGMEISRDEHTESNDHDWEKIDYEEFNWGTGEIEIKTATRCSSCGIQQ